MTNPLRGEAALGEHKLVVTFNGWCSLEKVTGLKLPELLPKVLFGLDFGVDDLRTYIRVFIDKPMSDEEVGNLIDAMGMAEVKVPPELWRKGDSKTQKVFVAAAALREAIEGYQAQMEMKEKNPPLAA